MKKGLLIGGGVLVLAALVWFGVRHFTGTEEADGNSDAVEITAEAAEEESASAEEVTPQDADEQEKSDDPEEAAMDVTEEDTDDSEDTEMAEEESSGASDASGNTRMIENEDAETEEGAETAGDELTDENAEAAEALSDEENAVEEVAAVSSDENLLYAVKTSAGDNLGMVPVVNGNAVVMLDGSYTSVYQGNFSPEETDAFSLKMENETAKALSNSKIGEWAFYREEMLQDYTFPEGVTVIEKFAFARSSLSSIVIPEGVTSIGFGAFYHCDALSDVVIPDSVTTIEANAFSYTPWLQNWMAGAAENEEAVAGESDDFLIVGDGILLAYRGSEENPVLPETVKSVVPGALGE